MSIATTTTTNAPIKFTTDTPRVKSITFHPLRPWVLIGLANGTVQIWDYRLESLVKTYNDGSNSPIRCVQWHQTQPIFAAGGDDEVIKVWNYQTHQKLFQLTGHTDYIRSLHFHHEQPWLISCSDDQTAKIWNWQSRQCIGTLLGHHYYVMDCKFHPFLPLIATASLDNTVRIWNFSQMLLKQAGGGMVPPPTGQTGGIGSGSSKTSLDILPDIEIVGVIDQASYISTLTWYYHQPTSQTYLFFAGKDPEIKVFTLNESTLSTYHHETLRLNGHTSSITSLTLSQSSDSAELLSTSEDGSAKIWVPTLSNNLLSWANTNSTPVQRPDGVKVWSGAIDSKGGRLYAAGYETGFCIFKIARERYGFDVIVDGNNHKNQEIGKVIWMCSKNLQVADLYTATREQDEHFSNFLENNSSNTSNTSNLASNDGRLSTYNRSSTSSSSYSVFSAQNNNQLLDLTTNKKDPAIVYTTRDGLKIGPAPQYIRSFYTNPYSKSSTMTQILYVKGGTYTFQTLSHPPVNSNSNMLGYNGQNGQNLGVLNSQSLTDSIKETFTGSARFAFFLSNTRICLMTKDMDIVLINFQNEIKKKINSIQFLKLIKQYMNDNNYLQVSTLVLLANYGKGDDAPPPPEELRQYTPLAIFPGPNGYILVRVLEFVLVFDTNNPKVIADFSMPSRLTLKRLIWSPDGTKCIMTTKTLIYIMRFDPSLPAWTRDIFKLVATHVDTSRIKCLSFDYNYGDEIIIFNTSTHLKYLMLNGHVGILKTLTDVCYLAAFTMVPQHVLKQQAQERLELLEDAGQNLLKNGQNGSKNTQTGSGGSGRTTAMIKKKKNLLKNQSFVLPTAYDRNFHYFTRQGKYAVMRVNCVEYIFKMAVNYRTTKIVAEIMFSGLLTGFNITKYVSDMGCYDLALHLSTNPKEKFHLSLKSGNLKDAIDSAIKINEKKIWDELSFYALQCGNVIACEQSYINTHNLYHLSFLYILTGQKDKLEKITQMCLAQPPSVQQNSNQNSKNLNKDGIIDQYSTYELGIWLSFYLGRKDGIIGRLVEHLTGNNLLQNENLQNLNSNDEKLQDSLLQNNNIFNKSTILMLLKFTCQVPLLNIKTNYTEVHDENLKNTKNFEISKKIKNELDKMNDIFYQTSNYETQSLLHNSDPKNIKIPYKTIYEQVDERDVDCIGNYPLSANFLKSIIKQSDLYNMPRDTENYHNDSVSRSNIDQNGENGENFNNKNGQNIENLGQNDDGEDDDLEDALVDILVNATNLNYSKLDHQLGQNGQNSLKTGQNGQNSLKTGSNGLKMGQIRRKITLPPPTHLQNDQQGQNGQNDENPGQNEDISTQGLVTAWEYLSQQDDFQSQSSTIISQATIPWPLISMKQLTAHQIHLEDLGFTQTLPQRSLGHSFSAGKTRAQREKIIKNQKKKLLEIENDDEWFQDILSHAHEQGLDGGQGSGSGQGSGGQNGLNMSENGQNQGQNGQNMIKSPNNNQETWNLDDLGLEDDEDEQNNLKNGQNGQINANNNDFMDFDTDTNQNQGQNGQNNGQNGENNGYNPILVKCGAFLALSDGPNPQKSWGKDIYQPQTQDTTSTSRQFLALDYPGAFTSLQNQVSPTLIKNWDEIEENTQNNEQNTQNNKNLIKKGTNNSFLTTLSKNILYSTLPIPAIFSSLGHLDITIHQPVTTTPTSNDNYTLVIPPQTTVPLQCSLTLQNDSNNNQNFIQNNNNQNNNQNFSLQQQQKQRISIPLNPITINTIKDRFHLALQFINNGQYDQALLVARHIFQILPLTTSLPSSYPLFSYSNGQNGQNDQNGQNGQNGQNSSNLMKNEQNIENLRFLYNVPYFTRELVLWLMCEDAKIKTEDPIRKAIYSLLSTFANFSSFFSSNIGQNSQIMGNSGQNDENMGQNQLIYDILLNTYWLACKYIFSIPQSHSVVILLCKKILGLAQLYHSTFTSNKVQYDTVRKLLKKCENESQNQNSGQSGVGGGQNQNFQNSNLGQNSGQTIAQTQLTFMSPVTKQQERVDYNSLLQLVSQTQQIGPISFRSQFSTQISQNLPKNVNISLDSTQNTALPKGLNILICSRSLVPITTPQILQTNVVLCSFCHASAFNNFTKQQCRVCQMGTYGGITATTQNGLQYQ